jgi:hypothetical protein
MITLATLKLHLNLPDGDTDQDTVLTAMETQVVAAIERETNRYFGAAQQVYETMSGAGRRTLWLSYDVSPTTALTMSYRIAGSLDWIDFTSGSYERVGRQVTIFPELVSSAAELSAADDSLVGSGASRGWPPGYNNIRATYTRGFGNGTTDCPSDIRAAVIEWVGSWFRSRVMATAATNPLLSDAHQGEINGPTKVPKTVAGTIALWRIPALVGANGNMREVVVVPVVE